MARELNADELRLLASDRPWEYDTQRIMYPLWRSFELDETEGQRLDMIEENIAGYDLMYRFIGRITGIHPASIDSVSYTPGMSIVSVVPRTTPQQLQAFLRSKQGR